VWDALKTDLETRLRPDVETLERAGFPVRTLVRFGDPAEEIVAVADGEDVDMVVIATHGRSGLRRALMGSVAETVLRRLVIPVMMVRPQPLEVPDAAPS
jgi:nucleotide-binding universal stress UspA family protein